LVLAACAPDDDDVIPDDEVELQPGFDDCADNPNTCNAGERDDGGSITWVVNALPGAWNALSPEGGSVYTLKMLQGIFPHTGTWLPDGVTFEHNMDLLAAEPELLSEDPFSFQFQIREEAVWNDGTPISADDFIALWKLASSDEQGMCEGCRSRSTGAWDQIESIEGTDDDKTVTVTLEAGEANPEWTALYSSHGITGGLVPAHVAEEEGFDLDDPADVGEYFEFLNDTFPTWSGGPYVLVEGDLENQVIKEPNENWYGEVDPTLDTIVIRFIDDEPSWIPALATGEIHGSSPAATFDEDIIAQIEEQPNVFLDITRGPSWEHIDFNLDVPEFDDVALRQAIFTAIDVDDIVDRTYRIAFPDATRRTNHQFDVDSPYHVDHVTATGQGSGDVDAALEILEGAGYEFDGQTLTLDGEQVGPFRLRATPTTVRVTSMNLVQDYLADIGIEIIIETIDDLGAVLEGQDYDIVQFGWSGSPFFTGLAFQQWHSDIPSNFGNYSNPEVDELSELARSATTLEEAAEHTNAAAEIVTEDAYVLPIADVPVYIFVTDSYTNIRDNTASSLRGLYNHEEWGLVAQ
jgi:peptide/nickel transport system substrate-binding protein